MGFYFVSDAIKDLDRALEINGGKGKVGIQALTQRGILRKVFGEDNLAQEDWEYFMYWMRLN